MEGAPTRERGGCSTNFPGLDWVFGGFRSTDRTPPELYAGKSISRLRFSINGVSWRSCACRRGRVVCLYVELRVPLPDRGKVPGTLIQYKVRGGF